MCAQLFKNDKTKSFYIYDPETFIDKKSFFKADLTLSLDVIYHLVEDQIYEDYMYQLFTAAKKYVIIYSSDTDQNPPLKLPHYKNRYFTKWLQKNIPNWKLIKVLKNKYPKESDCRFFIYEKNK